MNFAINVYLFQYRNLHELAPECSRGKALQYRTSTVSVPYQERQSDLIQSDPTQSHPIRSNPIQIQSNQNPIQPQPNPIQRNPIQIESILNPIQPNLIRSNPIQSNPNPIQSNPNPN